jgi:hypothetical protein
MYFSEILMCFALFIRQVLPITELLQTQLKLLFVNL